MFSRLDEHVLHLSTSLTFDLVDFTQMYTTLKLFSFFSICDRECLIEYIDAESDQGSFETA